MPINPLMFGDAAPASTSFWDEIKAKARIVPPLGEGAVVPPETPPVQYGNPNEVPNQQTVEPSTAGGDARFLREQQEADILHGMMNSGANPARRVIPGEMAFGHNKFSVQDPNDPTDVFDEAFNQAPARAAQAVREEANVIGQQGDRMAQYYKAQQQQQQQQLAAHEANRLRHQEIIDAKLAEYDAAAQKYSNDLADTGHFWKNPGNVVAAIGVALSNLAGKRDSAEVLNNMIVQDFNMRKQAADMRLGAMRSNIEQYRQVFGDKEAGDMYALSESFRIGALEVKQIGAQFQGPLAKANAERVVADMMQKSDVFKMKAWESIRINPGFQQKAVMDALRQAEARSGRGFYQSYIGGPQDQGLPPLPGPNKPVGGPVMPSGGVQFGAQSPANQAAAIGALGGKVPAEKVMSDSGVQNIMKYLRMDPGSFKRVTELDPRATSQMVLWRRKIEDEVGPPTKYATEAAYDEAWKKTVLEDEKKANTVSQDNVVKQGLYKSRAWGVFAQDIAQFKVACDAAGVNPDDAINWFQRGVATGPTKFLEKYASQQPPKGASEEEIQKYQTAKAVLRFRQIFSGKLVTEYHDKLGGAQTDQETRRMESYISENPNFAMIQNFANQKQAEAGTELDSVIGAAGVGPSLILKTRLAQDVAGKAFRSEAGFPGFKAKPQVSAPEGAINFSAKRPEPGKYNPDQVGFGFKRK